MSFDVPAPPYGASDPLATFVSSSCLDFLLIELVPMAFRLANELAIPGPPGRTTASSATASGGDEGKSEKEGNRNSAGTTSVGGLGGSLSSVDEEERREAAYRRLEMLGYRVGQGLAERPRFVDMLDVIKFLCKDLWMLVFRKQIDNLKTNHRGVYVLTDNSFRPFSRMSMHSPMEAIAKAQPFLWFPCGLIRGALNNLGINATVQAETSELPGATFQIKTITGKAG